MKDKYVEMIVRCVGIFIVATQLPYTITSVLIASVGMAIISISSRVAEEWGNGE